MKSVQCSGWYHSLISHSVSFWISLGCRLRLLLIPAGVVKKLGDAGVKMLQWLRSVSSDVSVQHRLVQDSGFSQRLHQLRAVLKLYPFYTHMYKHTSLFSSYLNHLNSCFLQIMRINMISTIRTQRVSTEPGRLAPTCGRVCWPTATRLKSLLQIRMIFFCNKDFFRENSVLQFLLLVIFQQ